MKRIVSREMFECVPEIDFMVGYQFFLKNLDNYTKAILTTLKSIKSKLPVLQYMIVYREYEGLRTITQTLRKMTENIGANEIAEAAYHLEITLLNEDEECLRKRLDEFILRLSEFAFHLELLFKQLNVNSNRKENASSFLNYDFTKTRESIKLSSDLINRKII